MIKSILTCFCNEFSRLRIILVFIGALFPLIRFSIAPNFKSGGCPSKTNIGMAPINNKLQVRKNKFLKKKKF